MNALPRALDEHVFSQISSKLSEAAANVAIFLDYDGTLTPIVSNPAEAVIQDSMRNIVEKLASKYRTSIVTGRNMETINSFMKLSHLHYAASHGFDIRLYLKEKERVFRVGEEYLPLLKEAFLSLQKELADSKFEGSLVEDNVFSLSIHYRNLKRAEKEDVTREIEQIVDRTLSKFEGKLIKTLGKMVFEVRPNMDWNKGRAVQYILQLFEQEDEVKSDELISVYIGDDRTDEDAFRVLDPSKDFAFLVSSTPRETHANFILNSPDEVYEFLSRLCL